MGLPSGSQVGVLTGAHGTGDCPATVDTDAIRTRTVNTSRRIETPFAEGAVSIGPE
jgi:hypothetical protein